MLRVRDDTIELSGLELRVCQVWQCVADRGQCSGGGTFKYVPMKPDAAQADEVPA